MGLNIFLSLDPSGFNVFEAVANFSKM